ncbi:transcriptional regulator, partial [Staphylococcus epidermidis MC28]|uniref:TetR/AcrR family transcriptional regulator C-terminal ligand-binding domain-containing protein n=3 Tax=Staphylococcus TaxID=1279 RepID=UPI0003C7BD47
DKSSIIMSAFIEQSQYIVIHNQDNLYDDLFQFLVKIKDIYKTKLGSAVIEILISHQQMEARETFMTNYFNHNRKVLKEIVRKHIKEEEQDLFIDLIFSPIYFNILIKPETLDENYIKKMLNQVLRIYH